VAVAGLSKTPGESGRAGYLIQNGWRGSFHHRGRHGPAEKEPWVSFLQRFEPKRLLVDVGVSAVVDPAVEPENTMEAAVVSRLPERAQRAFFKLLRSRSERLLKC